ncbi:holliday junction ATP-dependent DNA helicase RuvA [Clostridium acetireducens DSM 10703]|uniref:Holliday junction branch migration complex subunit RuvA n=1 Tax=Clostridium acetireducens DSM 10703 TaxID=1121290 RepID=A0A1E8EX75_9CLOT|nr:Holliday junction branch migration protein RuvA [Clostridium acetireducens]OFI05256.1 holliday junction ATP-dependent DNA helicase RuvA [Clostridium acetireducens DSM 10703]
MYEYIKGKYMGMNKEYIIIENNDIGYKIYASGNTITNMPKINESVILYLQQIVKQDSIELYGFLTKEERNMFNILLTINGVGTKAAMSLLSITNVNKLKYAILSGDENTITRAPGIGKKTAQRIILELKDKIKLDNSEIDTIEDESYDSSKVWEALEALVSLGYSKSEAEKALNKIDKNQSIEDIIKNSLKYLMN